MLQEMGELITENRAGLLQISLVTLRKLLKLPDDIKLVKVRQTWELERNGTFEVLVTGPTLPEVYEGDHIPWIGVTVYSDPLKPSEIKVY